MDDAGALFVFFVAPSCVPADVPVCALVDVFLGGLNVDAPACAFDLAGAVGGTLDLAGAEGP